MDRPQEGDRIPYNGLNGKALSQRGSCFKLQKYKRVGNSGAGKTLCTLFTSTHTERSQPILYYSKLAEAEQLGFEQAIIC